MPSDEQCREEPDGRIRYPVPRAVLRCRERDPGRLELRVVLGHLEHVRDVRLDERDDEIHVAVRVCTPIDGDVGETIDCPVREYLGAPLGDRVVLDVFRDDAPIRRFVPDR